MVFSFFEFLYSKLPRGKGDGKMIWRLTRSGTFDVRSYYNSINASSLFLSPGEHLAREGPLKGGVLFILFMDNSLGLDSYN